MFSACSLARRPIRSITLIAALVFASAAFAHFNLNLNLRVIHVDHQPDGLHVYLRLPMPYLVAHLAGEEQADGTREPAPFTTSSLVDDEWMHYVDYSAVKDNPTGLGTLAAEGHIIAVSDTKLLPEVKAVRVYQGITQPPFSTLHEAKRAFQTGQQEQLTPAPFVGDSVVDVLLHYGTPEPVVSYELSSTLNPGLEGQDDTANLILDYAEIEPTVFRIRGLLSEPVDISRSAWQAARTFVIEGVRHILGGYDHVLFVVCLVLGAAAIAGLAWRITGFTIGHSMTLTLGFFGYVPSAPWFIPLIEAGIAVSIILAALMALNSEAKRENSTSAFLLTALIGMLHGLGFSFVLQEILSVSSPTIWTSLLSFNLGVELGQLAIVLLLWPLLLAVQKFMPRQLHAVKWAMALPCIMIAAYWTGERMLGVINAV